jgi:hypothetical protein
MTRLALAATAAVAVCGVSASTAVAATQTKFPNQRAACVAQAWVPNNTDPTQASLGSFIRGQAQTGEWGQVIRQEGCKP